MEKDTARIVIAGHVDHGKSTLIGRILFDTKSIAEDRLHELKAASRCSGKDLEFAFLIDQFFEERRDLMTIDTSQVSFKTKKRRYVVIDSPGHVEFTKNMITGATHAEAAILIVSVKEGIEEQTMRHASILGMLGLDKLIVLVNKMDLVDYGEDEFEKVNSRMREFLGRLGIIPYAVIPISALKGDNILKKSPRTKWYSGMAFLESLDSLVLDLMPGKKPTCFSVQDVYNFAGKEIVVGRVESGMVKKGDRMIAFPAGKEIGISELLVFGRKADRFEEGVSAGLAMDKSGVVSRGCVLFAEKKERAVTRDITASIFWLSPVKLGKNSKLFFRCASQETTCRVERIEKRFNSATLEIIEEDADTLNQNEAALVRIVTEQPVMVENFSLIPSLGRFVLEGEADIYGAGIVLNVPPSL